MIRNKLEQMREVYKNTVLIYPRPNDLETGLYESDINSVACSLIDGFCVPKVNNKHDMLQINDSMSELESKLNLAKNKFKIMAQIETAEGFVNMKEIFTAGKDRLVAGVFGADDFLTDMGIERKHNIEELDFFRKKLALHCQAHNIVSVDTPYVQFKNPEGLKIELEYLKSIGIKAKFAIHPLQVDIINESFQPAEAEVQYAIKLVEEFEKAMDQGKAAIDFDNKMVDVPVYKRMLNMLKRAGIR